MSALPSDDISLVVSSAGSSRHTSDPLSTKKSRKNRIIWFYLVGILLNILYLPSIFDTYFSSILTTNIPPTPQTAPAPAERVVIFLLDGTRADVFFGYNPEGRVVTPFVRNIIETKGSYGVSFSRAPTESRVCSIAVMAGFHEDPNAITKMWKEIPTPFDHLFNHTSYAWSAGTPDIVTLFPSSGNRKQTVNISGYPDDDIAIPYGPSPHIIDNLLVADFASVMNSTAINDTTLNEKLHTPKVGFLFHLIAADIAGDMYRSTSMNYYNTVSNHDQLINDTVTILEAFYNDNKTAYIVTADHGVFDRGGHGDGSLNTTRAPFVAWGAGISGPIQETVKGETHDDYSKPWGLEGLARRDIHQLDISSLASSVIGVPVPVNNLGTLPVDYLSVDDKSKSEFLLANAKQICAIYQKQNEDKKEQNPLFISYSVSVEDVNSAISSIEGSIQAGNYDQAQEQSYELIGNCKDGNTYLLHYDWRLLFALISLGFIGYALFGLATTLRNSPDFKSEDYYVPQKRVTIGKIIYAVLAVFLLVYFALKKAPVSYYIYAIFPLYFWFDLLFSGRQAFKTISISAKHIGYTILALICLELLVWAQINRRVLALVYVPIALWQIIDRININRKMLLLWTVSCLVMAQFPVMLPVGARNPFLYHVGSFLVVAIIAFGTIYWREKLTLASALSKACVLVSIFIAYSSDNLITTGGEVPMLNKAVAWGILIISLVLPIIFDLNANGPFMPRLLSIFTCLASPLILVSTSYEVLFFACFAIQLAVWIGMEKGLREGFEQASNPTRFKNSLFILFFATIAFFGIQNLASLAAFLESGLRFVKIVDPSTMGGLLMLRILCPFILMAAVIATVSKRCLKLPSINVLVIPTLSMGAIVTMNIFLLVKNTGSWMEMGNSVARYIISSVFIVVILALAGLGHLIMRKSKGVSINTKPNWTPVAH